MKFDIWAPRGDGKQRGWSRIGWDLTPEEVEDLVKHEDQYHIEEARET